MKKNKFMKIFIVIFLIGTVIFLINYYVQVKDDTSIVNIEKSSVEKEKKEETIEELKYKIISSIQNMEKSNNPMYKDYTYENLKIYLKKYLTSEEAYYSTSKELKSLIGYCDVYYDAVDNFKVITVSVGDSRDIDTFLMYKAGDKIYVEDNLPEEFTKIISQENKYLIFYGRTNIDNGEQCIKGVKLTNGKIEPYGLVENEELLKADNISRVNYKLIEDNHIDFKGIGLAYKECFVNNQFPADDYRSGNKYLILNDRNENDFTYNFHPEDIILKFENNKFKLLKKETEINNDVSNEDKEFKKLINQSFEEKKYMYNLYGSRVIDYNGEKRKFEITSDYEFRTYALINDKWVLEDFFNDNFDLSKILYRDKNLFYLKEKSKGVRRYDGRGVEGISFSRSSNDIFVNGTEYGTVSHPTSIKGQRITISIEDGKFKVKKFFNNCDFGEQKNKELEVLEEIYTIEGYDKNIESYGKYYYYDKGSDHKVNIILPYLNRIIAADENFIVYCGDGKTFAADIGKKTVKKISDYPFEVDYSNDKKQEEYLGELGIIEFKNGIIYYRKEKEFFKYEIETDTNTQFYSKYKEILKERYNYSLPDYIDREFDYYLNDKGLLISDYGKGVLFIDWNGKAAELTREKTSFLRLLTEEFMIVGEGIYTEPENRKQKLYFYDRELLTLKGQIALKNNEEFIYFDNKFFVVENLNHKWETGNSQFESIRKLDTEKFETNENYNSDLLKDKDLWMYLKKKYGGIAFEGDNLICYKDEDEIEIELMSNDIYVIDENRNFRVEVLNNLKTFKKNNTEWRFIVSSFGRHMYKDLYLVNIRTGEKVLIDENVRSKKDTFEFPGFDFRREVNNWWNEIIIVGDRIYYNNDEVL